MDLSSFHECSYDLVADIIREAFQNVEYGCYLIAADESEYKTFIQHVLSGNRTNTIQLQHPYFKHHGSVIEGEFEAFVSFFDSFKRSVLEFGVPYKEGSSNEEIAILNRTQLSNTEHKLIIVDNIDLFDLESQSTLTNLTKCMVIMRYNPKSCFNHFNVDLNRIDSKYKLVESVF